MIPYRRVQACGAGTPAEWCVGSSATGSCTWTDGAEIRVLSGFREPRDCRFSFIFFYIYNSISIYAIIMFLPG